MTTKWESCSCGGTNYSCSKCGGTGRIDISFQLKFDSSKLRKNSSNEEGSAFPLKPVSKRKKKNKWKKGPTFGVKRGKQSSLVKKKKVVKYYNCPICNQKKLGDIFGHIIVSHKKEWERLKTLPKIKKKLDYETRHDLKRCKFCGGIMENEIIHLAKCKALKR